MTARALRAPRAPYMLPSVSTATAVVAAAALAALTVAAVPSAPYVPFVLLSGALIFCLAVASPIAVVVIGVLAIPFEGFTSFVIGPSQALFGAAAAGWLVRWLATRPFTLPRHPALVAFAALVVVNAAGLLIAAEPSIVARQVVTWGTMLVVAASIIHAQRRDTVRNVLLAFAICGGIAGVLAVVRPEPLIDVLAGGDLDRATAGLGSPNALGILLGMALPVQLMFALRGPALTRAVGAGCLVLSTVGLMLAVSRAAFIGLGVALLVLAFWGRFRRAALTVLPFVIVLAIATDSPVSSVPKGRQVAERVTELQTDSKTDLRLPLWKATPRMIEDHPFFGVGALEYGHSAATYGILSTQGVPPHAHNMLLTIAAELGLVGLAAFLALVFSVAGALRRVVKGGSGERQAMGYALAAAFAVLFVGGIFDYALGSPPIAAATFVLTGCAIALAAGTGRPDSRAS